MSVATRPLLSSALRSPIPVGPAARRASALLLGTASRRYRSARAGRAGFRVGAVSFLSRQAAASALIAALSSGTAATLCDDGRDDDGDGDDILSRVKKIAGGEADFGGQFDVIAKQLGSKVAEAVETGVPTQLSYGFVCGFCSGYALKKVGKAAAVVLGLGFMSLQTLNYSGYIKVDHEKLKKDVTELMDLNEDGTVDEKDAAQAADKVVEVMSFGLPSGCGFAAGFWGGLRSG